VKRRGVTLLEVLAAIFIMGVGLLALLTLFPLGALSMAQAIKDDRAASVAADAETFSATGKELISRTQQFVVVTLQNGSPDPKAAATLRKETEELAGEAAGLESRIRELRPLAKTPKAKRLVEQCLTQVRTIKGSLQQLAELLQILEEWS
jgi:prepilin-type N-terminal cleavage/methylation domain-containing protein